MFWGVRIVTGLLFVMIASLYGSAQEFFYSINLPANPFQQPYFQMMIKSDNPNQITNVKTLTGIPIGGTEFINVKPVTIGTDYVSYYTDGRNGNIVTIVYGLTPHVVRGYVEGIASTLYLQRPAQVTLPFTPSGCSPLNATFPDYSDAFLTQTVSAFGSVGWKDMYGLAEDDPLGAWLRYYPCIYSWCAAGGHCHHRANSFGTMALGFGILSDLAKNVSHNYFAVAQYSGKNYWPQTCSWGSYVHNGKNEVMSGNILTSYPRFSIYSGSPAVLPCSPVIWATGDFAGNFSSSVNLYSSAPATYYGSQNLNATTSYAEMFAQNMQYFVGAPPSSINPGQGVFSDAIQMAAMQAVSSSTQGTVYVGSNGNSEITGPVTVSGTSFTVPEAFLSKMTASNFVSSTYLSNAQSGWTGALGPQESAFEYYTGVLLHTSNPAPYFPFYLLEPGAELGKPGTNFCSTEDFQEMQLNQSMVQQMHVSQVGSPMVNLLNCLSGTRQYHE